MTRRGDRLRRFAVAIFDPVTVERVVDPAIADLQLEPFSVASYLAVLKVMFVCAPEVSMRLGTAAALSALATAVVVALLEVPPLLFAWNRQAFDARMLVYVIPQGLSIAFTVGLTLGVLAALGGRAISGRAAIAAIGVAMAVAVISFVNAGWVTPPANQAFRVALGGPVSSTGAPFQRGFNELTFDEVRQQYALATRDPNAVDPADLHYLAVSYHGRWAVTCSPIVFTIFALVLTGRRPLMRWATGLGVSIAYLTYLLSLDVTNLGAIDGRWLGGAAWYPLVALGGLIAAILAGSLLTRRLAPGVSA